MKTNFPTKKILVIIVILNILAVFSYSYLFFVIKNKNQANSILKNVLEDQSGRESELKLLGASLKKTEKERVFIESYFVQKGNSGVASFVEDLEYIAGLSESSLEVNSILLKEIEDLDVIEEMKLNFKVEGGWYDVTYFLGLLEDLPYKISFSRVYFEKKEDVSLWNGIFNISVLKLKDK